MARRFLFDAISAGRALRDPSQTPALQETYTPLASAPAWPDASVWATGGIPARSILAPDVNRHVLNIPVIAATRLGEGLRVFLPKQVCAVQLDGGQRVYVQEVRYTLTDVNIPAGQAVNEFMPPVRTNGAFTQKLL